MGQEFGKVVNKLGLKRSRRSFYALRHGFETVAGETADQVAVDWIMGHKVKGVASAYIERVMDNRRRLVVEHVRQWLFATPAGGTPPPERNSGISDPSDPCGPDPENPVKTWAGSHGAAQAKRRT